MLLCVGVWVCVCERINCCVFGAGCSCAAPGSTEICASIPMGLEVLLTSFRATWAGNPSLRSAGGGQGQCSCISRPVITVAFLGSSTSRPCRSHTLLRPYAFRCALGTRFLIPRYPALHQAQPNHEFLVHSARVSDPILWISLGELRDEIIPEPDVCAHPCLFGGSVAGFVADW